ncbi:hypothetical protein, partial [Candidatus Magnetobacterium casense]
MFTIEAASRPFREMIQVAFNDVHPPLQFILYWFGGYRLIPLVAGIISCYLIWKLTHDRLATLIFAINPYFIHLSGETRGYGLLLMFSLLVLCGYKWAFPCALLTEHYAWMLLFAVPIAFWMLPWLLGSLSLIAYQSFVEECFKADRGFQWSLISVIKKLGGLVLNFAGGVQYSFMTPKQAWASITHPITALYGIPVLFLWCARNRRMWLLLAGPVLLLLLVYPIRLSARYLPMCSVAFLVLTVEGYRSARKLYPKIALSLMSLYIAALIYSLSWFIPSQMDCYHRENWIAVKEFIETNVDPGKDAVIGALRLCPLDENYKVSTRKARKVYEIYQGNPD